MILDFQMNLKNHVRTDYKKNILAIHDRARNLTKSKNLFENKEKQISIKCNNIGATV